MTSRFRPQRWHVAALLAVLGVVGFLVLRRPGAAPPAAGGGMDAAALPAPAPPGALLGELVVPSPNRTWTRIQRGVGGALGILPMTVPGVLAALADLDPQLAGELDGSAPMYAAASGELRDPAYVVAFRLTDPRHARNVLTDGDVSRFSVRQDGELLRLLPRSRALVELALTEDGWLLAGSERGLAALGPHVTRAMPLRSVPDAALALDVPADALARTVVPQVTALWAAGKAHLLEQDRRLRAERGRAPDFGEPAAIVAIVDGLVTRATSVLADLDGLHLALDVEDEAMVARIALPTKSQARAWVDEMRVGDLAPLDALPRTAAFAMVTRSGEAEREAQARGLEDGVRAAFHVKDDALLHETTTALAKARDEVASAAVLVDEPTGLFLRAPVRDAEAATRALRGVVQLAQREPFKELLHAKEIASGTDGDVTTATLVRARTDAGAPRPLGLAWRVKDGVLLAGAGAEPAVTLRAEGGLGALVPRFARAVGSDASSVLVVQPLRLDPKRAALPPAPAALAVGKKGTDAFVRIEAPNALLREAVRSQMGL